MRPHRVALILVALVMLAGSVACSNPPTSPTSVTAVTVTGVGPSIGASTQFTATATLQNGTTQDVTTVSTWSSSNTVAATVSTGGLVTGVSTGTSEITATYLDVSGTAAATVVAVQ